MNNISSFYGLLILISFVVILLLREILVYKENKTAKYFLTPMITFSIASMVVYSFFAQGPHLYSALILLALLFALIADTLLMVIEVSLLPYGLVFFLLTHVLYVAAFSQIYVFNWWNILIAGALGLYLIFFYKRIKDKVGSLKIPVLIYMTILSTMVFLAVSSVGAEVSSKNILIAAGALLFAVSDSILATNEFVNKIPHSTVYTWATYGPAQMLIALSCLM